MKTLFLLLPILLTWTASGMAATPLSFTWEANDPIEQITGYRLYMDSPANMVLEIPDPLATACSYAAPKGNHAFSLTAYRTAADGAVEESGQSDYAIYAEKRTPIPHPKVFKRTTK